ncbi:hypothetical protein XBI1_1440005 [Xenorhabdus bovienii str. Intermedium]|uniref:Uncharacterized protein n=1 Tax=Xenorhabdus bovienii str. Intermedium TaxID=1379677 RepID=A0A077QD86_XENBV|nr:hypothetical protein XBI1_1440005 [Xenorhabdus bovienii str. Intermedium]
MLFAGRYNFKKSNGEPDVDAISLILEMHVKQHLWNDKCPSTRHFRGFFHKTPKKLAARLLLTCHR